MDTIDPTRFILAFAFVLGLIGLLALVLKKYGKGKAIFGQPMFGAKDDGGRVQLLETRYIDARRRLVLIRRDNREHLLLLADGRELVVESFDAMKEETK
ncbi:MAG: hypothetical protein EBR02_09930 [Alphaproteobacteria bacterium]|nr:hypothetical protein [Alphaproteobacteria bacterium]